MSSEKGGLVARPFRGRSATPVVRGLGIKLSTLDRAVRNLRYEGFWIGRCTTLGTKAFDVGSGDAQLGSGGFDVESGDAQLRYRGFQR